MKDMTMCAQHGDLEGLAQALAAPDAHERVNDVDYRGRSPLLVAVQANQPEAVERPCWPPAPIVSRPMPCTTPPCWPRPHSAMAAA